MVEKLVSISKGAISEVFLDLNSNNIIKKYFNDRGVFYSIKNYTFLKNNKFKTYEFFEKFSNDSVRMENLTLKDSFCVSPVESNISENNLDATYLRNNKLVQIKNFDKLIEKGFADVGRLCELNFDLGYSDIYFFMGKKEKEIDLNFIYGDLEKCNTEFELKGKPQLQTFYHAIFDFLTYFVEKNNSMIYKNFLNKYFEEEIKKYELRGIKFMNFEKIILK